MFSFKLKYHLDAIGAFQEVTNTNRSSGRLKSITFLLRDARYDIHKPKSDVVSLCFFVLLNVFMLVLFLS